MDSIQIKYWIVERLNQISIVELTDASFYKAFPNPKGSFVDVAIKNMLLVNNGNRPIETSEEILEYFCKANDLKYWRGNDFPFNHYFCKKITRF